MARRRHRFGSNNGPPAHRPTASSWWSKQAGKPALALALEVVKSGPFRIARFMGGSHANGNFPVADPSFLKSGKFSAEALLAAVRTMRPDVDALVLSACCRNSTALQTRCLALPHFPSPNIALAADLAGGFEGLLSRVSGKRKRKKHRWAMRKFEAAGGLRRIEAQTADDVSRLLDAYFAMKESRFRKMGIADVFGDAEVRNFFRSLFSDALEETPRPSSCTHSKSAASCAPSPDRASRENA